MNIDPRARPFLEALAVFAFWAALLAWILADAEGILGVDGYYHFRIGQEILERGPWVDIRWLPFTVLGEHGPDHHWLFSPYIFMRRSSSMRSSSCSGYDAESWWSASATTIRMAISVNPIPKRLTKVKNLRRARTFQAILR